LRKIKEPVIEVKEILSHRWMAESTATSWHRIVEEAFIRSLEKLRDSLEEEDVPEIDVSVDID
jgi:hypothetical protein